MFQELIKRFDKVSMQWTCNKWEVSQIIRRILSRNKLRHFSQPQATTEISGDTW